MTDIGKRIKELRESIGMTQTELAQKLGYKNKSTIGKIETGINDIVLSKVVEFANALHTSVAYLMGWEDDSTTSIDNIYPIELKRIPLLGEIACGVPKYANEDRESYIMTGTNIQADFCLKAKGDSMINARIHEGDIVFIRKQDIVANGEIAAVVVNNDIEATLKRFYYYAERCMVILKAENPAYEDMIFTNDELDHFHVLGKAVAFQSDVK